MLDPTGYASLDIRFLRNISWKEPCRVATTGNVAIATALNAGDTLDGVVLAAGDRVLVKDQTTASQNGIYVAGATPGRAYDMDQDATTDVPGTEVLGAFVYVVAGTTNGGKVFRATNTSAPTIGTTALTFAEISGDASSSGPAAVQVTAFDEHDILHGYTLTKRGAVITQGGSGSWKQALVESPNVFWDPRTGKYVMVFVGYQGATSSPSQAALGVATSTDLFTWTEYGSNPFFTRTAVAGDPDEGGTTGPFVRYEDGVYHLFYIGLTGTGYEAGTKRLLHATSTDWQPGVNAGTWTRHGAVISPSGSGWRDTAIWHPNIVKRGDTYYLFFNANGTTETIGYATSTDLSTWTVDDVNSPVLSPSGGGWESGHVGDPYVYRIGETWYMAHSGATSGNVAQDGIAFTSDADFPLGWVESTANPVLVNGTGGAIDTQYAAKPCIFITPTTYFHWYTAIQTGLTSGWCIALATESLTAASATPSGPAGGDLSGTYPNPSVVDDSHNHTAATLPAPTGSSQHILLADGHATPFTFNDLLQMDDGSDFMWSDPE